MFSCCFGLDKNILKTVDKLVDNIFCVKSKSNNLRFYKGLGNSMLCMQMRLIFIFVYWCVDAVKKTPSQKLRGCFGVLLIIQNSIIQIHLGEVCAQ